MKLTHSQISEILSNYTSSSEGFVTLQSLIMNSLMYHERELFVSENAHEQCNGFLFLFCDGTTLLTNMVIGCFAVGTVTALSSRSVFRAVAAETSIPFS